MAQDAHAYNYNQCKLEQLAPGAIGQWGLLRFVPIPGDARPEEPIPHSFEATWIGGLEPVASQLLNDVRVRAFDAYRVCFSVIVYRHHASHGVATRFCRAALGVGCLGRGRRESAFERSVVLS